MVVTEAGRRFLGGQSGDGQLSFSPHQPLGIPVHDLFMRAGFEIERLDGRDGLGDRPERRVG